MKFFKYKQGEFKDGLINGKGKMILKNNAIYDVI